MTIYDYALLCAERYSLDGVQIKGRGHTARAKFRLRNELFKLLPRQKLTERDDNYDSYSTVRITARGILDGYRIDLMAAGIDLDIAQVVNQELWDAAQAVVRLTGEPYSQKVAHEIADRVQAEREARADRELSDALLNDSL